MAKKKVAKMNFNLQAFWPGLYIVIRCRVCDAFGGLHKHYILTCGELSPGGRVQNFIKHIPVIPPFSPCPILPQHFDPIKQHAFGDCFGNLHSQQ